MNSSDGERPGVPSPPATVGVSGESLLGALPARSLERLRDHAESIWLKAGEWLFREGDPADCAYIVRSGQLQVISDGQIIRSARRGAVIGELALLISGARTASVRALRTTDLWRVGRGELEHLIMTDPQFAVALCRVLGSKLAEHRSPVRRSDPPRRIAIVALGAGISTDDVASHLSTELSSAGEAAMLRSDDFAADANYVAAIERAEGVNRWIVLSAGDRSGDRWPDACLAEADRVIALSRGRPTREWTQHAPALHGCELVVLGTSVADGLLRTLEPAIVQTLADATAMRHWVALRARRLAGQAVGVVFSGGGARAFAHLGVVEELRAAGIRIDRVGGVSMGALVAGLVGIQMDDDLMFQTVRRYFVDQNPTRDYTLPAYSLIRGLRTRRSLADAFGETVIEALPVRFFCVSTDLNRRAQVIHRTGSLHQAIFASLALPGVFPPVPTSDGQLLVDGGVLDNLPVEVMAADAEGPVIAVDVSRGGPWQPGRDTQRSSWRAHARRLISGQDVQLPRLADTMLRTLLVGSTDTAAAARRHADVVITPVVEHAGLLEWNKLPQMRDAGRTAVRHLMERDPSALRVCR